MTDTAEPDPDGRRASSERTRQRLLDAAMTEFGDHGFTGARVAAIAARAGVNKQLISYHFGGKQGLYEQLVARWNAREVEMRADQPSLQTLVLRYLDAALADPDGVRIATREALDGAFPPVATSAADVADLRARQQRGELAPDLDPAAVLLAIMGMVTAPVALAAAASDLIGDDHERYAQQVAAIVERLAQPVARPKRTPRRR